MKRTLPIWLVLGFAFSGVAQANIKPEVVGNVEMQKPSATWLLARDRLGPFYIFDTATGKMHGLIDGTMFTPAVEPNHAAGEFYVAESYYSRGARGDRTDVLTTYNMADLTPKWEVPIPKKIAALPFRR